MLITTGFGYYKNSLNQIQHKYVLTPGKHPDPGDGLTPVEVADQAALDAIVIYVTPLTPAQAFNVIQFQIDLLANFGADTNILPYFSVVVGLASFQNFAGMSQMIDGLYGVRKITLDEVNTLGTVLAGQCIYLPNF